MTAELKAGNVQKTPTKHLKNPKSAKPH